MKVAMDSPKVGHGSSVHFYVQYKSGTSKHQPIFGSHKLLGMLVGSPTRMDVGKCTMERGWTWPSWGSSLNRGKYHLGQSPLGLVGTDGRTDGPGGQTDAKTEKPKSQKPKHHTFGRFLDHMTCLWQQISQFQCITLIACNCFTCLCLWLWRFRPR